MKRYGMVIGVNAEKLEEYKRLHAAAWPGVLKMIKECNIENYSIYYKDGLLFSYYEYVGTDYEADMAKMEADPVTQEWWTHTKPCFEKFAIRPDSEFYADMKPIFYFE